MQTDSTLQTPAQDIVVLKSRLKSTWMTGDYDTFSRSMESGAKIYFDGLEVAPGAEVLDVACGSGQLALIAARAGAKVVGCDIATNWLAVARSRAAAEGLDASFVEGDAEALPFPDNSFDVVASLVGAMFAPRPQLVASELVRVARPGGLITMANWTPYGFIGRMLKIIGSHIAPSGVPSPLLWGEELAVYERLGPLTHNLEFNRRQYHFEFSFGPDEVVEFFRANYGPVRRAFESLSIEDRPLLHEELSNHWAAHNTSKSGRTSVHAEYLEVRGRKP